MFIVLFLHFLPVPVKSFNRKGWQKASSCKKKYFKLPKNVLGRETKRTRNPKISSETKHKYLFIYGISFYISSIRA